MPGCFHTARRAAVPGILVRMSEWANYVIVPPAGEPERYEDRRGAFALELDLLPGPDVVIPLVRSRKPGYSRPEDWAEAAVLIDLRERVLLFFVSSYGVATGGLTREVYLERLAGAWPGWQVRWAYDGVHALRRYLGADPVVEDVEVYPSEVVAPGDERLGDIDPLVSLATVAGGGCYLLGVIVHLIAEGPALLDRLAGAPDHGTCALTVEAGIHVDPARRQVGWWTYGECAFRHPDLATRWPGWRVEFWADRAQEHARASAGRFTPPPIDRRRADQEITRQAREHWSSSRRAELTGPALAAMNATD